MAEFWSPFIGGFLLGLEVTSVVIFFLIGSKTVPDRPMHKYGNSDFECYAFQASDSMVCTECKLTWDVNGPNPPYCHR